MDSSAPNVISPDAAATARSLVFERRSGDRIDPRELVDGMLAAGHGSEFPSAVRRRRLRTWARQVLRRLGKHGWLDGPGPEGWAPTAALRVCPEPGGLARRAPRDLPPEPPSSPPPEYWPGFVEAWVFRHRDGSFELEQIALALVERGFGEGEADDRLESAREQAEDVLRSLHGEGLLKRGRRSGVWQPTEVLATWPTADG